MRAFEVRIKHRLFEFRIAYAPAKPVRQHRRLSSRVNNNFRKELLTRAVLHLHLDADRTIFFKQNLLDLHALMDHRALIGRVVDQQLIKLGARHLPGNGTLVMHSFKEIERTRFLAGGVCKLHAVLAHKRTILELLEQPHATEGPVSVGHQRLANVMARKHFFLKQNYLAAFARQNTRDGTPGRSTTHYNDVVIICVHAYRTVLSSGSKNSRRNWSTSRSPRRVN